MPDFRVYSPLATAAAAELHLGAAESHHLVVVNRCSRGDPVVVFNGRGREWQCECADPAKTGAILTVRSTQQAPARAPELTLAQALPKGATMDEIVRQATELGVVRIIPLLTERTQVHLDGERAAKKVEKWHTGAVEAAKQCGNPWLPAFTPVQKLADLLAHAGGYELKLVASLHAGATSLRKTIETFRAKHGHAPRRVLWLVGPEGDFSPAEMTECLLAGCVPITLGPLVLRCDTAAVAALAVVGYELNC